MRISGSAVKKFPRLLRVVLTGNDIYASGDFIFIFLWISSGRKS